MLNLLHSRHKGISSLQKPEKIYLENTNLAYALAPSNTILGSLRETFFLNQIKASREENQFSLEVAYPENGDFLVDTQSRQLLFEVGGKNKSKKQLGSHPDSYVAADDIEIGFDRKVPLWLFGFLY